MAWWHDVMAEIEPKVPTVLPPGPRTESSADFVALGYRVLPEHRALLRKQWRAFVAEWGTMPVGAFEGRGIAILSGNVPYLVPSIIALKALRRTGCTLPVEFWFPANETPTLGVAMKLHRLGATVHKFPVPTTLSHVRHNSLARAPAMHAAQAAQAKRVHAACTFLLQHTAAGLRIVKEYALAWCEAAWRMPSN